MPIQRCTLKSGKTGYKWGEHGKCYPTRAQAERQAEAAYAHGYAGDAAPKLPKLISPTGKDIPLKPTRPNVGIESAYRRKLQKLIAEMENSVMYWLKAEYRKQLNEIAMDASPGRELSEAIKRLRRQWEKRFSQAADDLARWFAQKTKDYTDGSLQRILKDTGFAVEFKMTEGMQTAYSAMIEENVGLIKSIASENLTQVEGMVMRSVQRGRDLEQLTKELKQRFAITDRRAKLIARDQNNKATAVITRQRQNDLGLTEAIWMHSHGGKEPRPSHLAADGKKYDINKGMYLDGKWVLPGEEINCRCVSRPVIPGWND